MDCLMDHHQFLQMQKEVMIKNNPLGTSIHHFEEEIEETEGSLILDGFLEQRRMNIKNLGLGGFWNKEMTFELNLLF